MKIACASATDVGLRGSNEDDFLVAPPLLGVADGMGGHDHGEIASRIAIEALGRARLVPPYEDSLRLAFASAHEAILADASRSSRSGMGTTLTAALFADGRCSFAHAGDSALYLVRGGEASKISEDQSRGHRLLNCLGVGRGAFLGAQAGSFPVLPGDVLILATDRLVVGLPDVARIASAAPIAELPRRLVERALAMGGRDNVTVVATKVLA